MMPRDEVQWGFAISLVAASLMLTYLLCAVRRAFRNGRSENDEEWPKRFELKREPYLSIEGEIRYRDSEDNTPISVHGEPDPIYPAMGLSGFWQPDGVKLGDENVEPVVGTLKTWPDYFQLQWDGLKPFEIRRNDRDFEEGQLYYLAEYRPDWTNPCPNEGQPFCSDSGQFTGRKLLIRIKYVMRGPCFGLQKGWVAFGHRIVLRMSSDYVEADPKPIL